MALYSHGLKAGSSDTAEEICSTSDVEATKHSCAQLALAVCSASQYMTCTYMLLHSAVL